MKKVIYILSAILLVGTIVSCGSTEKKNKPLNTTKSVNDVLEEGASKNKEDSSEKQNESSKKSDNKGKSSYSEKDIDIDLTTMGSDMIYANIYQMMTEPSSYEGKVIRIVGNYNANWYEPTKQYIHCVIIQDATACCAQGMEFIWDDGSHVYPDEYPKNDTEITVTGVFETYQDDGDSNVYCRLKDACIE